MILVDFNSSLFLKETITIKFTMIKLIESLKNNPQIDCTEKAVVIA